MRWDFYSAHKIRFFFQFWSVKKLLSCSMSENQEELFIGDVSEEWKTYIQYVKLREICYSLRKTYTQYVKLCEICYSLRKTYTQYVKLCKICYSLRKTYIQYVKLRETCYFLRKTYTQYVKLRETCYSISIFCVMNLQELP